MKPSSYMSKIPNLCLTLCLLFLAFNAVQAQSSDLRKMWTTVGSTGTVDEADVSKVFFNNSIVQMGRVPANHPTAKSNAIIPQQTRSAVIRYNVTPVDGLFNMDNGFGLRLRYLASGVSSRVVAKLIEVDMATGRETARLTFDSNGFSRSDSYQVQNFSICELGITNPLDFVNKGYYIEATLTTNAFIAFNSAAGIQMIKITNMCLI